MKRKQIIKFFIVIAIFVATIVSFSPLDQTFAASCGGANTAIITCNEGPEGDSIEETGIWAILMMAINILTGLIAVAALFGIVYGAVLYTSAGGNQEQVKKAIGIFTNVGIGIIAYALMYIALNFLIPGGAF